MAKYQKVIDWISKNIDNGTLKPGSRIPSENELCAKFGLSRQTVRHAILMLAEEGLLESRRGSGTYVADQKADEQPAATRRKAPAAARRVPVQYTPRIPTARCPGC